MHNSESLRLLNGKTVRWDASRGFHLYERFEWLVVGVDEREKKVKVIVMSPATGKPLWTGWEMAEHVVNCRP